MKKNEAMVTSDCFVFEKGNFSQVRLLIEYGASPEAMAQKRDVRNGAYLTCNQLAQEVGFANYEQVKTEAVANKEAAAMAAQKKRNEKGGTTIPNASTNKNAEDPQRETANRKKQHEGSNQTGEAPADLAEEGKDKAQKLKSPSGKSEKSDEVHGASSNEDKTEKVNVKSWVKDYKQRTKNNTSEQKTDEGKVQPEGTLNTSSGLKSSTQQEEDRHNEKTGEATRMEEKSRKTNAEEESNQKCKVEDEPGEDKRTEGLPDDGSSVRANTAEHEEPLLCPAVSQTVTDLGAGPAKEQEGKGCEERGESDQGEKTRKNSKEEKEGENENVSEKNGGKTKQAEGKQPGKVDVEGLKNANVHVEAEDDQDQEGMNNSSGNAPTIQEMWTETNNRYIYDQ